jgi:hypothetical protein
MLPSKGMKHTQTAAGSQGVADSRCVNVSDYGPMSRGERQDPPKGAQLPAKGMKRTQTRNSLSTTR